MNCTLRYFKLGNQCMPCSTGCISCVNASMCLGCDLNYTFDANTYACSPGVKANCTSKCLICNAGTPNICLLCESGYYINPTSTCSSCKTGCSKCSNSSDCLDNSTNTTIPDPSQGTSCLISQWIDSNGTCRPCPVYCIKCKNTSYCT